MNLGFPFDIVKIKVSTQARRQRANLGGNCDSQRVVEPKTNRGRAAGSPKDIQGEPRRRQGEPKLSQRDAQPALLGVTGMNSGPAYYIIKIRIVD